MITNLRMELFQALICTHLVVCDVLDLAGEGDVAADPHRVVGQGLEEGRAVCSGGRVAEGGVGGAAWIRYNVMLN